MRTVGISRKLVGTLVGAIAAPTIAFVVNWISSGQFDRVELSQLVQIVLTAVFGAVTGYLSQPDTVTHAPEKAGRSSWSEHLTDRKHGEAGYVTGGALIALILLIILVLLIVPFAHLSVFWLLIIILIIALILFL